MIASNDSPTAAPLSTDWRPLAPGARGAGLLSGAIEFVTMSGLATAADWLWLSGVERWPFPTGALTAVAVAYFAFSGFVHPILLFRSWRWRLDASALVTHSNQEMAPGISAFAAGVGTNRISSPAMRCTTCWRSAGHS